MMPMVMPSGRARTAIALAQYAAALPADRYDVRIIAPGRGPQVRAFTRELLLGSVGWLRHCNAAGGHVYLRPLAARHVLIDDLTDAALARLAAVHHPACIVETSPGNYQAWITVSEGGLDAAAATRIAQDLASRFGGDPGAASAGQLGRAPGLRNSKPRHVGPDGRGPWVVLRHAQAGVDPAGEQLIRAARAAARASLAREVQVPLADRSQLPLQSPAAEYAEAAGRVARTLPAGCRVDQSRVDYAIARRLIARDCTRQDVEAVLRAGAKARALRDAEAERYVRRTVAAAMANLARGGRA